MSTPNKANTPPPLEAEMIRPATPAECTTYFRIYWHTYQISGHSTMWIQPKTDFGEDFLKQKAR
jgi:hypothetical protein